MTVLLNSGINLPPENPFIPTKTEAQETFLRLDNRLWMQVIDARFHEHGPLVFDKGLHGFEEEPGFFPSLERGCRFASRHLTEKPSLPFYKRLHKFLCAHFKGNENNTLISADKTGKFRKYTPHSFFSPKTEILKKDYNIVNCYENPVRLNKLKHYHRETYERLCKAYPSSKQFVQSWNLQWERKANQIDDYIAAACKELSLPKFVSIQKTGEQIYLNYHAIPLHVLEHSVQTLFDRYNKKTDEINCKLKQTGSQDEIHELLSEKIEAIASLFQMLEWLHPFQDGQGRTDLVLLAKLLSEEGFNPSILYDPYFSSTNLLPKWKDYLIQGMGKWREVASAQFAQK